MQKRSFCPDPYQERIGRNKHSGRIIVNNHTVVLIIYMTICAGAPQIALMEDRKPPVSKSIIYDSEQRFIAVPSHAALRNGDYYVRNCWLYRNKTGSAHSS